MLAVCAQSVVLESVGDVERCLEAILADKDAAVVGACRGCTVYRGFTGGASRLCRGFTEALQGFTEDSQRLDGGFTGALQGCY